MLVIGHRSRTDIHAQWRTRFCIYKLVMINCQHSTAYIPMFSVMMEYIFQSFRGVGVISAITDSPRTLLDSWCKWRQFPKVFISHHHTSSLCIIACLFGHTSLVTNLHSVQQHLWVASWKLELIELIAEHLWSLWQCRNYFAPFVGEYFSRYLQHMGVINHSQDSEVAFQCQNNFQWSPQKRSKTCRCKQRCGT